MGFKKRPKRILRRKWPLSGKPLLRSRGGRAGQISYIVTPVNGQPCAFVPHPDIAGAYMKVDVAVVLNACGVCGADKGEPCISPDGNYWVGRHVDRCIMSREKRRALKRDQAYLVCKDNHIVLLSKVLNPD